VSPYTHLGKGRLNDGYAFRFKQGKHVFNTHIGPDVQRDAVLSRARYMANREGGLDAGQRKALKHVGYNLGTATVGIKPLDDPETPGALSVYDLWDLDPLKTGKNANYFGKPWEYYDIDADKQY